MTSKGAKKYHRIATFANGVKIARQAARPLSHGWAYAYHSKITGQCLLRYGFARNYEDAENCTAPRGLDVVYREIVLAVPATSNETKSVQRTAPPRIYVPRKPPLT